MKQELKRARPRGPGGAGLSVPRPPRPGTYTAAERGTGVTLPCTTSNLNYDSFGRIRARPVAWEARLGIRAAASSPKEAEE